MFGSSSSPDEERGDRWVVAQFVLMALIVLAAFVPLRWGAAATALAGIGAAVGLPGAVVMIWGWRALGPAATPFPSPRDGGRLVESGPYAFVRHPIYSGALLFFLGLALATSPLALAPLAALGVLWRNKAALEEELLSRRYDDYAEYRSRVRGAFIPRSLRAGSAA